MAGPDFGKMVGPLPLGAWVAVIGGGLGIALYTRNQSSGGPEIVEDTSGVPGVGMGGSGMGWVDVSPPANSGTPAITNNEEWARAAVNWLIASGYDPAVSDSAIRKYMAVERLDVREFALVTLALGKLGAPPILLPPPTMATPSIVRPVISPPTSPVPRPPAKYRYHTVRPGESLWRIGKTHNSDWQRIYNANRHGTRRADGTPGMIRNPNLIYPGWRLLIP